MPELTINRTILGVTVFVCGALVMVLEIVGSRIVSPFIGASTYIWTSLIGVILASLSLGYWLGGRMADRRPDLKLLSAAIFGAGGLVSATVLAEDVVLSSIGSAKFGIELKAVIAALLLFAPASVCLGVVTPFAVRLAATSVDETGRLVGRLYALSTIGSIVGTFAAGFFFIPFLGSTRTLYLIAGSLMILGLALVPFAITKGKIAAITLLLLGITANEGIAALQHQNSGLIDIDTEYSRVQIFNSRDPATGKPIRALATDPYFVQSAMFLEGEDLVLEYSKFYHLIGHFKPGFSETLMIGGAGYSFPKEYLKRYPNAQIKVVEIDPGMTQIARDHFRLADDPRLKMTHEDGRMFINRAPSAKYDAILMDAFGSLFTVPTHLTTVEAVRQFERILKPDGVVIFNLGGALSGAASGFLQAELATYREVFPFAEVFKVNQGYSDDRLQNLVIVASKSDLTERLAPTGDAETDRMLATRYDAEISINEAILTDDLAPVEYYNSVAQSVYLKQRLP